MNEAGNGTSSPIEPQLRDLRSLAEHGRQIQHDAEALAEAVRDATGGVQRYLTARVEQRPLSTLGVAAGVGYLLGGGLGSRLTGVLLGTATRVATALVAREVGARILPSGVASAQTTASKGTSGAGEGDHED
jgi:ElaB/YqjD/DUF883 family membrane-anchored ribosome-binding protein